MASIIIPFAWTRDPYWRRKMLDWLSAGWTVTVK